MNNTLLRAMQGRYPGLPTVRELRTTFKRFEENMLSGTWLALLDVLYMGTFEVNMANHEVSVTCDDTIEGSVVVSQFVHDYFREPLQIAEEMAHHFATHH